MLNRSVRLLSAFRLPARAWADGVAIIGRALWARLTPSSPTSPTLFESYVHQSAVELRAAKRLDGRLRSLVICHLDVGKPLWATAPVGSNLDGLDGAELRELRAQVCLRSVMCQVSDI